MEVASAPAFNVGVSAAPDAAGDGGRVAPVPEEVRVSFKRQASWQGTKRGSSKRRRIISLMTAPWACLDISRLLPCGRRA